MIVLSYRRGRIHVDGGPIYLESLEASDDYPAYMYSEIVSHLKSVGAEYRDEALLDEAPPPLKTGLELRDYQDEALGRWRTGGCRGIVVLPTGAGKTILAVKAVEELQCSTLVVVPTLVLVDQWRQVLGEAFGVGVGALGGGYNEIRPLTVATYDSASIRSLNIGNLFRFIVFDEVHHLAAPTYRQIAVRYLAPYRMGLTATLQADEATVGLYNEIVGPVVYSLDPEHLSGTHLAEYAVESVRLPLSPEESQEYERQYQVYRGFLRSRNIRIRGRGDYLRFVRRSARDPGARRALMARNRAMDIALNSSSKVAYLKALLRANPGEKTLIFTSHNKLVYRLSRELLIPAITHLTPREEREQILARFMDGTYRRIVTSRVLDEGVDVPDASVAVIISGSGSSRQFIQRLGRILRKRPGKQAVLYELVSEDTAETRISARRRQR